MSAIRTHTACNACASPFVDFFQHDLQRMYCGDCAEERDHDGMSALPPACSQCDVSHDHEECPCRWIRGEN